MNSLRKSRACAATYDGQSQKYALYACTQGTAGMRGQLVYTMGVPDDKIDVIAEDVGGGFGVRFNMYPEYCAVLLAAKKTDEQITTELYLAALGRPATPVEQSTLAKLRSEARERKAFYEDLVWSLLNSKQFLFVR